MVQPVAPHAADPVRQQPWVTIQEGGLRIERLAGSVPDFLIEANLALSEGRMHRVRATLSDRNLSALETWVEDEPIRIDLMYMVSKLLLAAALPEQAEAWCLRILRHEPEPAAYHHLAHCCGGHLGRQGEALSFAEKAYRADPSNRWYTDTYGRFLFSVGRTEEGLSVFERAVRDDPHDALSLARLLWFMHYVPRYSRREFFEGYRRWGRLVTAGCPTRRRHQRDMDPDRRLKVGFISPDFFKSAAATGFEPFLDGYNRDALQVYGYSNLMAADEVTQRIVRKTHQMRDVRYLDAARIAEMIDADQIDILVEIGGHVHGHFLQVLAHRPAPIQVDYGHIDTTGLEQIDYRLTDDVMDPPHTQSFYVERLVYLPGGANCFGPPLMSPMVGPQPAKVNGFVTFGSFNVNVKISTEILTLWAEVLREIPTSRLVMKFMTGHDPQIQAHYRSQFERLGVRPERITIHGRLSPLAHLDLLTSVDIALDCFPYNGCITTSEALWMGVPVLSLAGPTFISREGLSILRRVGLEAFVTGDTQDYVARACAFAGQIEAIEQIRFSLRQRMLGSPLCNPARFAREIEQAFRTMWRTWCDSQVSDLKSQISNEGGGR